ncbi:unnamed protein product, partial [Cladocopium goreaui]
VTCKETNVGDTVWVVGSVPELGSWEVKEGLQLETTADSFPLWKSPQVPIIPGKIQFKIVILSENGNARWEGTKNKADLREQKDPGDDMLCATMKMTEKDLEAAGVKLSKAQMDPAPEPAAPEPAPATPDTAVPPETEQGEGYPAEVPERTVPLKTEDGPPMQKSQSRHLFRLSDGSMQMDMTKTPSLMMMDLNSFMEEAEAEEKHVNELEERERLNQQQRPPAATGFFGFRLGDLKGFRGSGDWRVEMKNITDAADASDTVLLQGGLSQRLENSAMVLKSCYQLTAGFNWESHQAGKGNWYGIVESKVEMFADMGITDIWLPPCSQSVAPQGYLPSQLFNLDASAYGKKDQLKQLLAAMRQKGIRGMADIVINHRCGDQQEFDLTDLRHQDEQGRWNVFTTTGIESRKSFAGVMDWQGWAITLGDKFSDGTGERGPGQYDDKFDAAPDIDHGNKKVQQSIAIWMRWLRLDVGFDAWRFDFVKGYGAEYVGLYCKKSHPSWAVGELWLDMRYDDSGLCYDQNEHRQNTINWINATDKESAAFDFTTKGILQEACRNTQYWRLKDSEGKPPGEAVKPWLPWVKGLLGWMPTQAVTFLDNHDTGSTQAHWCGSPGYPDGPFPGDKVLVGYAYLLTHPGIPSIFWDHVCDWGDDCRERIKVLLKLRQKAEIKVDAKVKILCADADLYIAEIGEPAALRVALGPRSSDADGAWQMGANGNDYKVWISKSKTS